MSSRRLFVLSSGREVFRGYALRAIAEHADVVLISETEPTWERAYCAEWVPADLTDQHSVLATTEPIKADGLVTYDERYVELAALLAEHRHYIGPSRRAVRAVKDKTLLRQMMEAAGVPSVRFAVANTLGEAHSALAATGVPAIFKPRALSGSAGVRLVTHPGQVREAFEEAKTARVGTTRSYYDGVLIEEFVDGPEFSIDAITVNGITTPLIIAEKHTGLIPYFEEVGHSVPAAPGTLSADALSLVCQAHAIAGLDNLVTHAEVRVGPEGPRLIEINARLGGDLIPYLGLLAEGIDLAGAAAQIALGEEPVTARRCSAAAAVRFIYPSEDLLYHSVRLRRDRSDYPGLEVFEPLVPPGTELWLPPRRYLSRLAAVVVSGPSRSECARNLDSVVSDLVVEGTRLHSESRG